MSHLLATPAADARAPLHPLPLTARIREGTRAQHARCEAQMNLTALASSLEGYAEALQSFEALHDYVLAHTADVVAAAPAELGAGLGRGRARLSADLRALGQTPRRAAADPVDDELGELDAQLGAWYVLEGSALGGRVIARHVRDSLPGAAGALSYFRGEGPDTAARWQRFGTFANRLEADSGVDCDAVLRGAERTFDHFLSLPARR
jgi:heme oxygenase